MNEELTLQLKNLESNLQGKTALEVKSAIEEFKTAFKDSIDASTKSITDALELKFANDIKKVQDHADALDVKLQKKGSGVEEEKDLLKKAISENIDSIKNIRKGADVQVKAVGNMTTANVTGSTPKRERLSCFMNCVSLSSRSSNVHGFFTERGMLAEPTKMISVEQRFLA